jgi:HlyD family secretion protein
MSSVASRKKWYLSGVVALSLVAGFLAYKRVQEEALPAVQVDNVGRRDLASVVMASGTILPKRSVNISADTIGRVTRLDVQEGEFVKQGQFLLQIDPETLESQVQSGEAGLRAAREAVDGSKVAIEAARARYELALQNQERARALYEDDLVPKQELDRVEKEAEVYESELNARKREVRAAEERLAQGTAELRSARHQLSLVTIRSPMDGLVTQLNIEEGETVLVGTMNNPGTVVMTVADLSIVQAELEVDETDIVDLRLGQEATIRIDAIPNKEFHGPITKIGSSALRSNIPFGMDPQRAASFEVIVTLDEEVKQVRPGFSCSAEITTNTRKQALAVPIQALTTRAVDASSPGTIVDWPPTGGNGGEEKATFSTPESADESEGVFVIHDERAEFTPIEIGIAGSTHFEVLSGLREGDQIITGPYTVVRDLVDGSRIRIAEPGEVDDERGP